jgi:hypothetical protein
MTRIVRTNTVLLTLLGAVLAWGNSAIAASPGSDAVDAAARNNQFAFVMFYRGNDAAAQKMHGVLKSTLGGRKDAVIVPVQINNTAEQALIKQFDATRIPMPAMAVLAPNGAVCTVVPQRVSPQQVTNAIVSNGQAKCLKALQDKKIVLLCAQPSAGSTIPTGVQQFQADTLYKDRSTVVALNATDPAESKFLKQLRIRTDQRSPVVALMAPPGVMVGVFNGNVSHDLLAQKLAAAGKCCDDENCKHEKAAAAAKNSTRR